MNRPESYPDFLARFNDSIDKKYVLMYEKCAKIKQTHEFGSRRYIGAMYLVRVEFHSFLMGALSVFPDDSVTFQKCYNKGKRLHFRLSSFMDSLNDIS